MKTILITATFISALFFTSCSKNEQEMTTDQEPAAVSSLESYCEGRDDEDPQPMLYGNVTDTSTNDPIEHVCVELRTAADSFVDIIGTSSNGHFYFNTVIDGTYKLTFTRSGYITKVMPVVISGSPISADAQLKED